MEEVRDVILKLEIEIFSSDVSNLSLFRGKAGVGLFYYYLYELTSEKEYRNKCVLYLDAILEKLHDAQLDSSIGEGYAGITWFLNFSYNKGVIDFNPSLFFSEIDVTEI